ncbi:MAG: DUF4129 domain-containing protein [Candidatus Caldarchaeales archaeon]
MSAAELFYSPAFWVAVNAAIAAALLHAVRRFRRKRADGPTLRERFGEVKALLGSGGSGREYVVTVSRALLRDLRAEGFVVRGSMSFREAVSAVLKSAGSEDRFEDVVRSFEDARYGGSNPDDREVEDFRRRVGELIGLLEVSLSAPGEARRSRGADQGRAAPR